MTEFRFPGIAPLDVLAKKRAGNLEDWKISHMHGEPSGVRICARRETEGNENPIGKREKAVGCVGRDDHLFRFLSISRGVENRRKRSRLSRRGTMVMTLQFFITFTKQIHRTVR